MHNDYTCAACLNVYPEYALEADHIIPLSQGGPDTLANIQILCIQCHKQKTLAERSENYT